MTDSYIWEHMIERFEEVIREYDESIEAATGEPHSSIIIKPNETDTRDRDDLWFEIFPLHSQPYQQELGTSGRNRWLFGLQININAPRTAIIGTNDIDKAYDFIADNLKSYKDNNPDIHFTILNPKDSKLFALPIPEYRFSNIIDIVKKYDAYVGLDISNIDMDTFENEFTRKIDDYAPYISVIYLSDKTKD